MEYQKIKIYGERNSGTRYLEQLVKTNISLPLIRSAVPKRLRFHEDVKNIYFDMTRTRNLGWKHAAANVDLLANHPLKSIILLLTITKNPYSFLLSLFKRSYHYKGTRPDNFSDFIRCEWGLQRRDGLDVTSLENPIELWNHKNRSYIELKQAFPENVENMAYESLLVEPEATLEIIAAKYNLKLRQAAVANVVRSTKSKSKGYAYYKDYYSNERWQKNLDPKDVLFINRHLDEEVTRYFGYEFVAPTQGLNLHG